MEVALTWAETGQKLPLGSLSSDQTADQFQALISEKTNILPEAQIVLTKSGSVFDLRQHILNNSNIPQNVTQFIAHPVLILTLGPKPSK
jgi:hypothetical protein